MTDQNLNQIYADNPRTTIDDDSILYFVEDPDGTPDDAAIKFQDINKGWMEVTESWTYASATTINVPTGATSRFQKGWGVRFKQSGGTYKFGYLTTVAAALLTFNGGSDYVVANEAITDIAVTASPQGAFGFPGWHNYSPTFPNSASMTLTSVTTNIARFKCLGTLAVVVLDFLGTTGGTASNTLYATLPLTPTQAAYSPAMPCWVKDGASALLGYGFINPTGAGYRKQDVSNYGLGAGRGGNSTFMFEF